MTQKLCLACRHCTASNADQAQQHVPMCMKGGTSPVDGTYTDACWNQRAMHGNLIIGATCGPDGDWWEPRVKASVGVP